MTMRAKVETYQDQARLKVHIIRANAVNFANEGKTLLSDIAKYELPPPTEPAAAVDIKPEPMATEA